MAKKAILIILALLLIGAIGAGIWYSVGVSQSVVGSTEIWTVDYGRLECLEDQQQQQLIKWVDQGYEFECGENYVVDECMVYISCDGTPWYFPNCRITDPFEKLIYEDTERQLYTTLQPGQSILIEGANDEYTKVEYEFNPYRLYTYESGGKFISSSSDCCLANQNSLQKNQFEEGDWECLSKSGSNQFKNYFLNWERIYGARVYRYSGDDVVCRSNSLYELIEEDLENGETRLIQGDKIKNVECCPHQDNNCNDDFEFEQDPNQKTCTYSYQCENAGNPYDLSGSTYKIESCDDGKCVERTETTECTSDNACRNLYGDNYGCDLSLDNFGKCILIGQINQSYCGDGLCETFESYSTCPNDCPKECVSQDDCPDGYDCINQGCVKPGEQKCEPWIEIGGVTILPNLWCIINNFVFKFRLAFSIIVGLLSGLLTWLMSRKLSVNYQLVTKAQLKKFWYIPLAIGIVVGGILGFIAFTYFWTAFILAIFLLAIKIWVPGI